MVQLLEPIGWLEEEPPPPPLQMPQIRRPPPLQAFTRGKAPLNPLVQQILKAHQGPNRADWGRWYSQLTLEFQPALRWAISCWEYLLSTEGCRFVARSPDEKRYTRGDYRAFQEKDFERLVSQTFKESVLAYLEAPVGVGGVGLEWTLRHTFWLQILKRYRALVNPPDSTQRQLTGYSYLRCIPYEFLNDYHHHRVTRTLRQLPALERQVLDLYYLRFYKEEAALQRTQMSRDTFRRRRSTALRKILQVDTLSYALLVQIERY